jgi:hypothetical protein
VVRRCGRCGETHASRWGDRHELLENRPRCCSAYSRGASLMLIWSWRAASGQRSSEPDGRWSSPERLSRRARGATWWRPKTTSCRVNGVPRYRWTPSNLKVRGMLQEAPFSHRISSPILLAPLKSDPDAIWVPSQRHGYDLTKSRLSNFGVKLSHRRKLRVVAYHLPPEAWNRPDRTETLRGVNALASYSSLTMRLPLLVGRQSGREPRCRKLLVPPNSGAVTTQPSDIAVQHHLSGSNEPSMMLRSTPAFGANPSTNLNRKDSSS